MVAVPPGVALPGQSGPARGHRAGVELVVGDLEPSLFELQSLPQHDAVLPIACVEGWSAVGQWSGVRLRDLLDRAGIGRDRWVRVESLEQAGLYRASEVSPTYPRDPADPARPATRRRPARAGPRLPLPADRPQPAGRAADQMGASDRGFVKRLLYAAGALLIIWACTGCSPPPGIHGRCRG